MHGIVLKQSSYPGGGGVVCEDLKREGRRESKEARGRGGQGSEGYLTSAVARSPPPPPDNRGIFGIPKMISKDQ